MAVKIFHNPRCSKSRATLALLEQEGVDAEQVLYLDAPPTRAELVDVLRMLGMKPRELMRTGEAVYRELGLNAPDLDDDALIDAMIANPILIERPIVIANGQAAIGRPPERVLDIL